MPPASTVRGLVGGSSGATTMPVDTTVAPVVWVVRYMMRHARASKGTPMSSSLRIMLPEAPSVAPAGCA